MTAGKRNAELGIYITATILTMSGAVLCLTGLFLPNWYLTHRITGNVITRAKFGLWQDEICHGLAEECTNHWLTDSDYSRWPEDQYQMPSHKLIQGFETAGAALALLALLALIPVWACFAMGSSQFYKILSYICYFTPTMIAAFLSIVGCLIIASEGEIQDVDFAPFLSGIGGAVLFISGCMSCVVCRYDPTYGTLENPVSPTYITA